MVWCMSGRRTYLEARFKSCRGQPFYRQVGWIWADLGQFGQKSDLLHTYRRQTRWSRYLTILGRTKLALVRKIKVHFLWARNYLWPVFFFFTRFNQFSCPSVAPIKVNTQQSTFLRSLTVFWAISMPSISSTEKASPYNRHKLKWGIYKRV